MDTIPFYRMAVKSAWKPGKSGGISGLDRGIAMAYTAPPSGAVARGTWRGVEQPVRWRWTRHRTSSGS